MTVPRGEALYKRQRLKCLFQGLELFTSQVTVVVPAVAGVALILDSCSGNCAQTYTPGTASYPMVSSLVLIPNALDSCPWKASTHMPFYCRSLHCLWIATFSVDAALPLAIRSVCDLPHKLNSQRSVGPAGVELITGRDHFLVSKRPRGAGVFRKKECQKELLYVYYRGSSWKLAPLIFAVGMPRKKRPEEGQGHQHGKVVANPGVSSHCRCAAEAAVSPSWLLSCTCNR